MRVMVTGASGQLGYDVCAELRRRGNECKGVDREDFDISNGAAVKAAVNDYMPEVIVHCGAYTNVDKAEKEIAQCAEANSIGTMNIVNAANLVDAKVVYISTDYVFSGDGVAPYEVTTPYNPQNIYGLTKMQGEEYVKLMTDKYFIIRTSWVFGLHGNNFVKTMLRLAKENRKIKVVNDQFGSPTYTADLAKLIADMIETERYGIYHATNEGFCTWYDFACEILVNHARYSNIEPVTTEEYGAKVKRPFNSRLSKRSLDMNGFSRLPSWQDALYRFFNELNPEE